VVVIDPACGWGGLLVRRGCMIFNGNYETCSCAGIVKASWPFGSGKKIPHLGNIFHQFDIFLRERETFLKKTFFIALQEHWLSATMRSVGK
jgi:hypothetical protein